MSQDGANKCVLQENKIYTFKIHSCLCLHAKRIIQGRNIFKKALVNHIVLFAKSF